MVEDSGKPKVLIVDDTPENIQILMGTLKDEYAIVAADTSAKNAKISLAEVAPER